MHFIYLLASNGTLYYSKSSDSCNSFDKGRKSVNWRFWADMCLNKKEEKVYVVWPEQQEGRKGVCFSRSVEANDENIPAENTSESAGSGGGGGSGCFIHSALD